MEQNGLDYPCTHEGFLEGDEGTSQDRIQVVDAVRGGRKPFQLAPTNPPIVVIPMRWVFAGIVVSVEVRADPEVELHEEVADQVGVDVLWPPPHVLLLESTDRLADGGFDLALRLER
jgi:hypothetical protein